jgi:alkylation response protein AidB-like acyl-CoA dehydrogenase
VNFALSPEQLLLQQTVRQFCDRHIRPHAARWAEEARFPHEVVAPMAELGLWGMQVPETYGGAEMKMLDYIVALEEVACADGAVGLTMSSHSSLCTGHILAAGSSEQKRKYLPRLATGQDLGAWGLTEPGSGSDSGAAKSRARRRTRDGRDEWVISGSKTFVTQGHVAGVYVVLASTSPEKRQKGLTAFIIEKGTPGLRPGKHIHKMGLAASDTAELALEDVVVPDEQRLGEVDHGFFDILKVLDRGRIGIGAWSVGIGRAAYQASLRYAKERVQFGKPIAEFQAIRFMLADMATELDAARLLVWRAAWLQDRRQDTRQQSAMAKYYAARAAVRACNAAVQIHGGYGYTREFPVERYLRDIKLAEIGEGTNEIQKILIAREIGKEPG